MPSLTHLNFYLPNNFSVNQFVALNSPMAIFKEMKKRVNVQKLKSLELVDCNIAMLRLIGDVANQSLESLTIHRYHQPSDIYSKDNDRMLKEKNLEEMKQVLCGDPPPLRGQPANPDMREKFSKLRYLNFCSTFFDFVVPRVEIDEQNDQEVTITGSRDLELIFFGLKDTLKELHLGRWVYDELVIYFAEICKHI